MAKESLVIDGEVGFCHLTETDKLKDGKDTERYTITLNLDEETKDLLQSKGVKKPKTYCSLRESSLEVLKRVVLSESLPLNFQCRTL